MLTCQNGHELCARALIEAKVDLEKQTAKGNTALILSCSNGHELCAQALLKAGANVNHATPEVLTSLMVACQNNHELCARALLKAGANIEMQILLSGVSELFLPHNKLKRNHSPKRHAFREEKKTEWRGGSPPLATPSAART